MVPKMDAGKKGKIVTLCSNKGGTGKSTLSMNIAAALANKGYPTLIIDADSQCNTTANMFGREKPEYSLYDIFRHQHEDDIIVQPGQMIYPTNTRNLDILPNQQATALAESKHYQAVPRSYLRLGNILRDFVTENYQYIIVDTPPNLGFFIASTVLMSDAVIIPIEAGSQFALDGLYNLIAYLQKLAERNPNLEMIKIAINQADRRTNASQAIIDILMRQYGPENGNFVLETVIPQSTAIEQAQMFRTTVLKHASTTPAAKAFRQLADEVRKELES